MTPSPQLAPLTAGLLRSTAPFQMLGWLLCACDAAGCLLALNQHQGFALALFAAALSTSLALAWLSLRIRFDAAAFELIAQHTDTDSALQEFDLALGQLGLRPGKEDSRNLPERCTGARQLVTRLIAVLCLQFSLTLAGVLIHHVA